jgi:sugar/nucleoside kinase (ribokinase family)
VNQENPDFPATADPAVVVVGNLTIDDVVLPDGTTLMATLGGNSVHTAAAAVACGAQVVLVARRGEDFPTDAFDRLAGAGVDTTQVVDVLGPTVRNWVIYEPDGRRHWVYRTPVGRSAEVAPRSEDVAVAVRGARVVHVAAMPVANAEAVVAEVRRSAPAAVITLDTHEGWAEEPAARVLALAGAVDLFEPSLEELEAITGDRTPTGGLRALARAGVRRAVVKAGADGAYVMTGDNLVHVPALEGDVVDTTGAGDAFAAGFLASWLLHPEPESALAAGNRLAARAVSVVGARP